MAAKDKVIDWQYYFFRLLTCWFYSTIASRLVIPSCIITCSCELNILCFYDWGATSSTKSMFVIIAIAMVSSWIERSSRLNQQILLVAHCTFHSPHIPCTFHAMVHDFKISVNSVDSHVWSFNSFKGSKLCMPRSPKTWQRQAIGENTAFMSSIAATTAGRRNHSRFLFQNCPQESVDSFSFLFVRTLTILY